MNDWLNYHHLRYFWEAARAGTITGAAARLRLAQPTVSAQIRELEKRLGEPLFERRSRGLELTRAGRHAFHFAERIFGLGQELLDAFDPSGDSAVTELRVGVSDALSKLLVAELVEPLLRGLPGSSRGIHVICHEDKSARLISELTLRAYDVVLADEPVGPSSQGDAQNHSLGESSVTFFASPALADGLVGDFPASLHEAPVLLPTANTTMRRALDHWLLEAQLQPEVVGEFEDSALLKAVGVSGVGAFPVPTVVAQQVAARYKVVPVGTLDDVREPIYAITLRRGALSDGVLRLLELGRGLLSATA